MIKKSAAHSRRDSVLFLYIHPYTEESLEPRDKILRFKNFSFLFLVNVSIRIISAITFYVPRMFSLIISIFLSKHYLVR